jgi:3alpha(or 20beta)-hydroxysteroid dehydrogenase
MDLVDWNIRVNAIHPGQVWDTSFANNASPGHWEANWMVTPMGRHGRAEECANVVLFLASEESSFITGAEIPIDGGLLGAGLMRVRAALTREFATGARPPGRQAKQG